MTQQEKEPQKRQNNISRPRAATTSTAKTTRIAGGAKNSEPAAPKTPKGNSGSSLLDNYSEKKRSSSNSRASATSSARAATSTDEPAQKKSPAAAPKRETAPKKEATPKTTTAQRVSKQPTSTTPKGSGNNMGSRLLSVIAVITIVAISVYSIIASFDYILTWKVDQSALLSSEPLSSDALINDTGALGIKIASLIISDWFGIFGILLPISAIFLSLFLIYRKRYLFIRVSLSVVTGMVIWSTFATLAAPESMADIFRTSLGGGFGLAMNKILDSYLGIAGRYLLLIVVLFIWSLYTFPKSIILFENIYKAVIYALTFIFSGRKGKKKVSTQPASNPSLESDSKIEEMLNSTTLSELESVDEKLTEESPEKKREWKLDPSTGELTPSSKPRRTIADRAMAERVKVLEETETVIKEVVTKEVVVKEQPVKKDVALTIEQPKEEVEPTTTQPKEEVPFSFSIATDDERERAGTPREEMNSEQFEIVVGGDSNLIQSKGSGNKIIEGQSEALSPEEIDQNLYDPTLELSRYKMPPINLLEDRHATVKITEAEIQENKERILTTLRNFSIEISSIRATVGPTVTLYEIVPAVGVRISKIKNLEDDIALSLSALGIRIIAPMPGKGTIGIEVPNKNKEVVSMYSAITSSAFQDSTADLPIVLGRTIQNNNFVIDLAKMPHILVAGATGQGKSVGLNAIITSLIYKKHPSELKFVMVDPKKVELSLYTSLENHYLAKMEDEPESIITDTQRVIYTLNSLCMEMDERYELLKLARMKNIKEYNTKFCNRRLNPNKGHRFMPYIVVIIDEFADLIMTAGKEIETPISRIAQLARAVGIHLIIATQRPAVNVITGVIKANFPARIAFRVMTSVDSKIILDTTGANQLIGRGDMLVSVGGEVTRVQCAFVDTPEIEQIAEFIGDQTGFGSPMILPEYVPDKGNERDDNSSAVLSKRDALFDEIARYVVTNQQGSTSTIQRNFSLGFNRAGRIMDQLEKAGVVGKPQGSKPREVRITDLSSLELLLYDLDNNQFNNQ